MGREIAHVMGHQAINWLERDNREAEEAPSRAITELNLSPDAIIADIGAGSGYYTFRLSPLVPKGKVVAVDIQPEMIAFLEKREKELGLNNVEAHLGAVDSVKLPPNSIDAALFVDAYHEFSHPWEMMRSIHTALRPRRPRLPPRIPCRRRLRPHQAPPQNDPSPSQSRNARRRPPMGQNRRLPPLATLHGLRKTNEVIGPTGISHSRVPAGSLMLASRVASDPGIIIPKFPRRVTTAQPEPISSPSCDFRLGRRPKFPVAFPQPRTKLAP